MPQSISCYDNANFTNQGLDIRDNIVSWTDKDKKKWQTMRTQVIKYIKTVDTKTQANEQRFVGI